MDKRTDIIAAAERVFEDQGFRGIGVDRILAPSGASTRTLYKHFGSRDGLVLAVLDERHRDFMARLAGWEGLDDPVGHLFDVQAQWMTEHGARGCMLLRASSEYAGANPEVVTLVQRQKQEFEREIARRVEAELKRADVELATQIWLLFEGAVAAASVSDQSVLRSAQRAASILVKLARQSLP
jgi:AcrR family transcriptional regulator